MSPKPLTSSEEPILITWPQPSSIPSLQSYSQVMLVPPCLTLPFLVASVNFVFEHTIKPCVEMLKWVKLIKCFVCVYGVLNSFTKGRQVYNFTLLLSHVLHVKRWQVWFVYQVLGQSLTEFQHVTHQVNTISSNFSSPRNYFYNTFKFQPQR